LQAKGYGPKAGYFQPDSSGGKHVPFEFTSLTTSDPPHGWTSVHQQYDGGKMDGFWQASEDAIDSGDAAIGYYTAAELPIYYSLLDDSALCANYFCSLLGPTWPNRFYVARWPLRPEATTRRAAHPRRPVTPAARSATCSTCSSSGTELPAPDCYRAAEAGEVAGAGLLSRG
jgi:Phosphoesterase family